MAWTKVIVDINTSISDTGTVTAIYNDATYGDFVYTEQRVKADASGKAAFVTAANNAKTAWLTQQTTEGGYESAVLTALNA